MEFFAWQLMRVCNTSCSQSPLAISFGQLSLSILFWLDQMILLILKVMEKETCYAKHSSKEKSGSFSLRMIISDNPSNMDLLLRNFNWRPSVKKN